MAYCRNCGHEVHGRYCGNCGTPVEAAQAGRPGPAPSASADIDRLISGAFRILQDNATQIVQVGLLAVGIWLASFILLFIAIIAFIQGTSGWITTGILLCVLFYVVVLGAVALEYAMLSHVVAPDGRQRSLGELFSLGMASLVPLIGVLLLMSLIIGAGFILLVIPGLVAAVFLTYAPQAVVIDRMSVIGALQESYRLVSVDFWGTVLKLVVGYLVVMGISFVAGIVATVASVTIIGGPIVSALGMVVALGFTIAYHTLMYQDAKTSGSVKAAGVVGETSPSV